MSHRGDPQYPAIRSTLVTFQRQGTRLCYTSQTLGEFWNASTRPLDKNEFLPDSQAVHDRWRRLLVDHEVKGVQIHDARFKGLSVLHPAHVQPVEKGEA